MVGKKTLDNHMRKHNTAVTRLKRNHKCEECPYETKEKANLSKHTKCVLGAPGSQNIGVFRAGGPLS